MVANRRHLGPPLALLALAALASDREVLRKSNEENLAKGGMTTTTITALVPQDLEQEAHNTLWSADSPTELTLLKLCPSIPATSIAHEYDRVTSYGDDGRGDGFFSEESLPRESTPTFERVVTNIRLIGERSQTFLLASLEKTIKVDGQTGAEGIARSLLMKSLLKRQNRMMYFSDTSVTRLGNGGLRNQGLLQQIREGTDGTTGTSPYGSHIIDMEGQPFTLENARQKIARGITLFGRINQLIMDPFARTDFESGMDGAQRLNLPIDARPFMLGNAIGGFQTQGGSTFFHTDNALSPIYSQRKYIAAMESGAPSAPPTGTLTLNSSPTSPNVSKFNADDGGTFFWLITEIKNDRESLGRRFPTSGGQAVAAGQEVQFDITPNDGTSDMFKVYRGVDGDDNVEAWGIFEVSNSAGGASVRFFDLNLKRPNTSTAFGLNIRSDAADALNQAPTGQRPSYDLAVENSAAFLTMEDRPDNTVTRVQLGPAMGVMELAKNLAITAHPLLYSAYAMQVRNPLQNVVFINIGSASNA